MTTTNTPTASVFRAQSLGKPSEVTCRLGLLDQDHVRPLHGIVERLRRRLGVTTTIPTFDPCDGGIRARILLLLEAPDPRAHCDRIPS